MANDSLLARAVGCHQAGRLPEAEQLYLQVLQSSPQHPDALHLLGVVACQTGRAAQAVDLIGRAVALLPHNAAFRANLGNAHHQAGQVEAALAEYRAALRLAPDFVDAHRNLGLALAGLGQLDEAASCYQEALRLRPGLAVVYNDLGIVRRAQGRLGDAVACYREAIRHQPNLVDAHSNLGNALKLLGQLDQAEASCRQALQLNPDHAAAHNNLGNALADQGRMDEAIAAYRAALRCQPRFPVAHSNLLMCLNYASGLDPATVFAEHLCWASIYEPQPAPRPPVRDPDPERVLRVGYVSADLRHHPLMSFFEPILQHHDPRQVEIHLYAEVSAPDAVSRRLQALAAWHGTCGLSDAALAELVRRHGIDILVDLAGHTAANRLLVFTQRPAPVQITYLGYTNTTGLRSIDYRLGDAVMDPPGSEALNSETLVRLTRTACYAGPSAAPAVAPLPSLGAGHITFGSVHRPSRFNAAVLDVWCRILHAVPSSRMLLYRNTLTGAVADHWRARFSERGIAPARLDLRHHAEAGHLSAYGDIDISLDPFPCAGAVTSCESLWMGVPFVTLRGDRPAARTGEMLLGAVGLPELIAASADDYVAAALRLASDPVRLAQVRGSLRQRMQATLGDAASFTRELEAVYRRLWQVACGSASGPRV